MIHNKQNDTMVKKITEQTFNEPYCVPKSIIQNDLSNLPSTSNKVNCQPSWTSIDSTKLLKSTGKHQKLTSK